MDVPTTQGYLRYLISLRGELLDLLDTIEDANDDISLDRTKPNWQIAKEIQELLDLYVSKAESFGLYVVERHTNYQIPDYIELTPDLLKIASATNLAHNYDLGIEQGDDRFIWPGKDFHWGSIDSGCKKCSIPLKHNVIKMFLFAKAGDSAICNELSSILRLISDAKAKAADRLPRSGIREQLLLATLRINEAILPIDIETFIKSQSARW